MKFRFSAIDAGGRVVRGVLRAEDEADARETMIGEELYPKKLEPVPEDEKATWAPRRRIMERAAGASAAAKPAAGGAEPVSSVYTTRLLGGTPASGRAGITDSGAFAFVPENSEPIRVERTDLEEVRIVGFPARILRLTHIDGRMHEFSAGFVFASPAARSIAGHFRNPPQKDKK